MPDPHPRDNEPAGRDQDAGVEAPLVCPRCGSDRALPIEYGLILAPDPDREVVYGGCIVGEGMPMHHCADCEHDFGSLQLPEGWAK